MGVRPSMGSVGDAYDNALCESFFATLECELLDRQRFPTQVEARLAVFDFIEGWYIPHRRHSALDYESPINYGGVSLRPTDRPSGYPSTKSGQLHYLPDAALAANDVDNRMKDVFDALQGRVGGPKAKRTLPAIIPNDNQIFRVEMEKALAPKQSGGLGHVSIGRLPRGRKNRGG
jgi:hypothetical protein